MNAEKTIATFTIISFVIMLTFVTALLAVSLAATCLRWFMF